MSNLMRGVHDVRQSIASYLSDAMPGKIAIARAQWALPEYLLPVPLRYDSYDPLATDIYPTVGSLVPRTRMSGRIDWDDLGNEQYRTQYTTRVFIWTKTPEDPNTQAMVADPYASTLKVRDDLVAVLRATLLDDLSLGTAEEDRVYLTLNESSITEEYFDAMKKSSQTSTWFAGGSIAIDLTVIESQYRAPHGEADTINLNVGHLDGAL